MLTLSVMLAVLLIVARYEWRRVQAHEAKVAQLQQQVDRLSGLLREPTQCEVCNRPVMWLVPVMLYDAIEWACEPCSALFAAKEAA